MDDVKYGDILEPGSSDTQDERADRVRKGFWSTFKRAVKRLPFGEDVVAAYFCAFDPQTPMKTKGILLAALAYFVMPADAIPDFIAFIGFSDDIAVLAAALGAVRSQLKVEHYELARQALEDHS